MDNNNKVNNQTSDIPETDDSLVIISSDDESLQWWPNGASITTKPIRNTAEIIEQLNIYKADQTTDELKVLFSCQDVRLYLNQPDGTVTLIQNNATLRVIQFNETCTHLLSFCLQLVDIVRNLEWIYPLDKDNLHVFCTNYGAFIFPADLENDEHQEGLTYGLVIPKPADQIIHDILEGILDGTIREIPKDWAALRASSVNVVSDSMVKNSNYISSRLISGAEKLGEYLGYGTSLLTSNLSGTSVDHQPAVPGVLKSGIEVTRTVTGAAVNITGKCASAIGCGAMAVGRYLAPHIQSKVPPLLTGIGINQQTSENSVNNVLAVAGGTVEGVSTLYGGIEQSASILGKTVANNVVKIVEHKYGENYGNMVETTFDTAGNVINISQNVTFLTSKGLVKKTAKGASIAVVKQFKSTKSFDEENYPDLSGLVKELENDQLNRKIG